MRKQRGFSVIELLLVVAIILIIAAIALPNLLRARIAANEASAASGARTMMIAQMQYQTSYSSVGYAPSLAALGGTSCATPTANAACLIDNSIASATILSAAKDGYLYGASGNASGFSVGNYPASLGSTGNNSFCAFEDGVLRTDATGANNSSSCQSLGVPQVLTH
ncbi:MAG TPA: prepilin-type N-terminal cleavage/methylation domain-containing protein [Terriglobales bacterium]|jgi:type IV pilus assembly protein PilA|nr:prepilin-type N-terminal cleavage/methylation domain-containing protein [Terriglobales bacterium]